MAEASCMTCDWTHVPGPIAFVDGTAQFHVTLHPDHRVQITATATWETVDAATRHGQRTHREALDRLREM